MKTSFFGAKVHGISPVCQRVRPLSPGSHGSRPRAWDIHALKTIYVNANDLNEDMLAHEMAHAIVDHYLLFRPPFATGEILAQYADVHACF